MLFRDTPVERLDVVKVARNLRHARAQLAAIGSPALLRAASRLDVAGERLRLLDVDVGIAHEPDEVVGGVALHTAHEAPVVGQADLVHDLTAHTEHGHPARHEYPRLDLAARGGDGGPSSVPQPAQGG